MRSQASAGRYFPITLSRLAALTRDWPLGGGAGSERRRLLRDPHRSEVAGTLFPDKEYPDPRLLPARLTAGPVRSLTVAFVIVTVATIGLAFFEDATAQRHWHAIAAPVIPAVYVLASFFTGGAHGIGWPRFWQVIAVYYIALVMWWIVLEVCRRVWKLAG